MTKTPVSKGAVGIFWLVGPEPGTLVYDKVALSDAEPYGDCLTYGGGHFEYWEYLRGLGPVALAQRGLPAAIAERAYEEFPRGRIVYDQNCHAHVVFLDGRLSKEPVIARVCQAFGLATGDVTIRNDDHYRPPETQLLDEDFL